MSIKDSHNADNWSQHMLTTILYNSLQLDEEELEAWADVAAVKESVERLEEVHFDQYRPLDEVKKQLTMNLNRHMDFLEVGGAKALLELLKTGSSIVQRKVMRVFELLAKHEGPRRFLKEFGIGDTLLNIVRASAKRPNSSRRAKAGEILKLLAKGMGTHIPPIPTIQNKKEKTEIANEASSRAMRHLSSKHSKLLARRRAVQSESHYSYGTNISRGRPIPVWSSLMIVSILNWMLQVLLCQPSSAMGCRNRHFLDRFALVKSILDSEDWLVMYVCAAAVEESHQDCAHRIVRKILYVGQLTRHVIIDPVDVSDLISIIRSMHSSSVYAIKAATLSSIMHSSNAILFVKRNGIEALVSTLKADNLGTLCGEVAAWALTHFIQTLSETSKRIIDANGIEALVELSLSPETCSREAAIHAIVTLIKSNEKRRKIIMKKLAETECIHSLLSILQESYNQYAEALVYDSLWLLLQMAKHSPSRSAICKMDGLSIVQRILVDADRPMRDVGRRLFRILTSKIPRLPAVCKPQNRKGTSIRSKLFKGLKKVFKNDGPPEPQKSGNPSRPPLGHSNSIPVERRRPIPKGSISSLSSSIHSDYCDALLATAPGAPAGMTLDDLFSNNASRKLTYTMQPHHLSSIPYDKDFDPYTFGGRPPAPFSKVQECNPTWSSESEQDASDPADPEIITTYDFL